MTLGKAIRERRLEMGLTQEALAQQIGDGVRQAEVSRLESNRVALPRRRRLERIAQALDLSIGELLARSGWADSTSTEEEEPTNGLRPKAADLRKGSRSRFIRAAQRVAAADGDLSGRSNEPHLRTASNLDQLRSIEDGSSQLSSAHPRSGDHAMTAGAVLSDRRVHSKWLDPSVAAYSSSTSFLSDHPTTVVAKDGHADGHASSSAVLQDRAWGPIPHIIDRLTAATIETASIRRGVASRNQTIDRVVDDLIALEHNLKDIGAMLRRLHDEPHVFPPDGKSSDA